MYCLSREENPVFLISKLRHRPELRKLRRKYTWAGTITPCARYIPADLASLVRTKNEYRSRLLAVASSGQSGNIHFSVFHVLQTEARSNLRKNLKGEAPHGNHHDQRRTGIYYKDWGKGQPVIFSHGWPLSSDALKNQDDVSRRQGLCGLPMIVAVTAVPVSPGMATT